VLALITTILGCVVAFAFVKLLYAWVSRPRTNVHVHIAAPPNPPSYYPVPVIIPPAAPAIGAEHVADDDAELHGMIDNYYREQGPR
jgi:hypothetical protein